MKEKKVETNYSTTGEWLMIMVYPYVWVLYIYCNKRWVCMYATGLVFVTTKEVTKEVTA